jgi:hypothetical protein
MTLSTTGVKALPNVSLWKLGQRLPGWATPLIGSVVALSIVGAAIHVRNADKCDALLEQFKTGGQITCTFPGKSLRTFSLDTLAEPTSIPAREVLVDAFALAIKNGYCSFPNRSPS